MQNTRYFKTLTIFIGLAIAMSSQAQIVTSSFNKSMLAVNPAAAATKGHSFFSLSVSREDSKSKITETQSGTGENEWKSKYSIDKRELILTASGQVFYPELYLSADKLKKELSLPNSGSGESQSDSQNVDFINNLLNVGIKISNRAFWGIRFFMPKISYKLDSEYEYPDNTSQEQHGKVNDTMTGVGAGVTLKLTENTYFGLYYTKMTLKSKGTMTFTNNGNDSEGIVAGEHSFAAKGVGLSYKKGDSNSNALRLEVAYSMMDFPYDVPSGQNGVDDAPPKQIYLAGELTIKGIGAGLSVKYNKGPFREHMNMVKDSVDEGIGGDEFVPVYDYFFNFTSSKGHGGGIRGSYFKGKGQKKLFGAEQPAEITESTIGLSYSYTF